MIRSLIHTIEHQCTAYYQPIVELDTGRVVGFESLTRIRDDNGAVSSPGAFIDEIEGDIDTLTALVRQILCAIAHDMVPLFERYPDFYVSVNIPPAILGTRRGIDIIKDLHLAPYIRRLVVEVTERQSLTIAGSAALEWASANGIRIAIDDFGTGNSGISQIAGLDLDILKIDHALVAPVLTSRASARMLRGIVALASALHMHTIAEGVETWEQAFFMRAAGVDYGQGWYWSRALPAGDVEKALNTGFANETAPPEP
ncbi:MAG: EAL domain-containing protein [Deltaproteobacteria bacterium]|nr:EAL domain-containing protein [Deltaproteobacteria bacterium]